MSCSYKIILEINFYDRLNFPNKHDQQIGFYCICLELPYSGFKFIDLLVNIIRKTEKDNDYRKLILIDGKNYSLYLYYRKNFPIYFYCIKLIAMDQELVAIS